MDFGFGFFVKRQSFEFLVIRDFLGEFDFECLAVHSSNNASEDFAVIVSGSGVFGCSQKIRSKTY